MKSSEINNYVLHYLDKDKTNSAIMLSGEWGIGKSFYVTNELIPFLEQDKDYYIKKHITIQEGQKKYKCILISLYGLTTIYEISKSLFFETYTIKHGKTSFWSKVGSKIPEKWKKRGKAIYIASKGYGKTILKGIAKYI